MRHVIEVYGGGGLLQELNASHSNLGKLSCFYLFKMRMLLIISGKRQSLIFQETLEPRALIDSINAAFLVRFVGLHHHDLIKADRARKCIFQVICSLAIALLIDAFRYSNWIENI